MSNEPTRTVDASVLLGAVATATTTPSEAFSDLRSLLGTSRRTVDASVLLEAVATASTTPSEAFSDLRSLLGTSDGVEAVYEALKSLVWSLVASGEEGGHLDRWADLVLRLRQTLQDGDPVRAERFTVLADLLAQSSGFPVFQPQADVVRRKNVAAILAILEREGGRAARSVIQAATGLKDANLSRILANLAAGGLISRSGGGREVFGLTHEGSAEASRLGGSVRIDPV